jgi:hypothetical protein
MMLDSVYFHPVEWAGTMPMMNWAATEREVHWALIDRAAGTRNMEIDWRFAVGDVVKIRLFNERRTLHGMQHPIHLHGQRFLVVAQNGVRNEHLVEGHGPDSGWRHGGHSARAVQPRAMDVALPHCGAYSGRDDDGVQRGAVSGTVADRSLTRTPQEIPLCVSR